MILEEFFVIEKKYSQFFFETLPLLKNAHFTRILQDLARSCTVIHFQQNILHVPCNKKISLQDSFKVKIFLKDEGNTIILSEIKAKEKQKYFWIQQPLEKQFSHALQTSYYQETKILIAFTRQ